MSQNSENSTGSASLEKRGDQQTARSATITSGANSDSESTGLTPSGTAHLPKPWTFGWGNRIAVACVVLVILLIGWSQFFISAEANNQVCPSVEKAAARLDPTAKVVFPDADNNGQTFTLHGRLCLALNIRNYFGSQPSEASSKIFSLFIDGRNTGLKTKGFIRPESDAWLWLIWKVALPDGRDAQEVALWNSIMGQPEISTGQRAVVVGIGEEKDQAPRETVQSPAHLDLYDPRMVLLGAALLLILGASVFFGNKDTGLFRNGDGRSTDPTKLATYSLAKVQTGLWILLTIGGFLFIWAITGRSSGVVTTDIFALMGIQLGTGLAAVLVDKGTTPDPSTGFLTDILSPDGHSPALQRMQMAAWTLILGAIFISSIFTKLAFPALDTSLLVLIGFVNGNYLGFKFPEKEAKTGG